MKHELDQLGNQVKPVVVLIGMMGAGKTTVGGLVARRLGVEFRDADDDIAALAGKPCPDIFFDDGEARFRELEEQAVVRALQSYSGVLALGGGAVMAERTRAHLRGHCIVFLTVNQKEVMSRVGMNRSRPMLLGDTRARLRFLMQTRLPVYEELATFTVSTDGRTPMQVTDEIVSLVSTSRADSEIPQ